MSNLNWFPQDYLQKEHPDLRQIIEQCGGRYHVINNRQRHNREQVQQLLQKVRKQVKRTSVKKVVFVHTAFFVFLMLFVMTAKIHSNDNLVNFDVFLSG